jgi:AraC-like DNA-binding protein
MNNDSLFFSLSLDLPPILNHAEVNKRNTKNQTFVHSVTHWGLDFYHCSGQIDFLDYDKSVIFQPGDVGITGPNESLRVTDFSERESLNFNFNLVNSEKNRVMLPTLLNMGDKFIPLQNMAKDVIKAWKVQPKRAQALLCTILWVIVQHHDKTTGQSSNCPRCVKEITEIIELELAESLSLTRLAERVSLSPSRLSRLFHEHMGITLVRYIRKQRIDRACFLLRHTDMTLKEIGYRIGIYDAQVFNKSFKKEMVVSPSIYREDTGNIRVMVP